MVTTAISMKDIFPKRILFFLLIILVPNFLLMQVQIAGWVDDRLGLITAIDLIILLPLTIFLFGFRKKISILFLFAFMFTGLLLANLIIPNEAKGYLSYLGYSSVLPVTGIFTIELIIFITVLRKIRILIKNFREAQERYYHFLLSFSMAIEKTFSFKNRIMNKFLNVFRIVATDIAAIHYSLFSWKKKPPTLKKERGRTFTLHKDGAFLGVFILLVHAMAFEIVGVHLILAKFDHTIAWIVTALDIYLLLFIVADYQAIRLSPMTVDSKGIHFQKGIRQYGFIPFHDIKEIAENTKNTEEIKKDRKAFSLALHGFEKNKSP